MIPKLPPGYLDFPEVRKGAPMQPNVPFFVERLVQGCAVRVSSPRGYKSLFRSFRKYSEAQKLNLKLFRREREAGSWFLTAGHPERDKPSHDRPSDKRLQGRFRYHANRLREGAIIIFKNHEIARLARRRYMLYTPKADRTNTVARLVKKGGAFLLSIEPAVGVEILHAKRQKIKASF